MVTYLRFIILAMALCIASPCVRAAAPATAGAGVSGEVKAFVDNIEYSTRYRIGETLFGASAVFRFYFEPSDRWLFAAGIYGLRRFGDERFFSLALPVFRAQYTSEKLTFILGEIILADAHGLPDALYRQEYRFDPGIEEGIQFRAQSGRLNWDLWAAWDSLNTPESREHFTAGSSAVLTFDNISFPVFIVADHSGGERYEVPGQPVQEHFGGAAGVAVSCPVHSAIKRVFGQILAVGSAYRVRTGNGVAGRGYGVMGKAGIAPFGFDCSAQWFKGRDFWVPSGDPLYRSGLPVYALEAARSYSLNDRVVLSGGIRFETERCSFGSYFSNPRYRWWVSMRGVFDRRLGK
jgi:hypothetical protein